MRFILIFILFMGLAQPVKAQGLSVIRDTEIESTLRDWAEPIFRAAGLSPSQVKIVLVDDSTVNAFVAGGSNIFIYAGLIQKAEFPEEVIGVMAHETGHITGGHLIASRRAAQRASYQSILASVLGIGAAIATGDGGAASAITMGGSSMAASGYLSHSRVQESAADQAALRYFREARMSPEGLVTFLQKLEGQELLPASQQSEYMRTHPLTRDRIESMRRGLDESPYAGQTTPQALTEGFKRIKAKLIAFREPQQVPRFYRPDSDAVDAQYAYAIMNYRQSRIDEALAGIDALIARMPNDPHFHEMKGQILRDAGRLAEAEESYRKSLSFHDGDAPLVQIALAHILIELKSGGDEAEILLKKALTQEEHDTRPYRLLATIEGRRGNEAAARYYLAEEAAAHDRIAEAQSLVALAMRDNLLEGSLAVKAQDLKKYLDTLPDEDN